MRILWHMPALYEYGDGLSMRAYALAGELAQRGHAVTFCALADRTFVAGNSIKGFPVERLPAIPDSPPIHWCLQAMRRTQTARILVGMLDRRHHLFISCQPEVVSAYRAVRRQAPVVFVSGSSTLLFDGADLADQRDERIHRRLSFAIDRTLKHRNEVHAYRSAHRVVFDSHHTRERVMQSYRIHDDRLQTVEGGVNPREFAPPTPEQRKAARDRLGVSDDAFVVMGSGRLVERKGFALLVAALSRTKRPITGVIVGDGPQRGVLQTAAANSKITLHLPGMTADVQSYLHAADIYAFTSICESFGGALVEAMACGLPCIGLRPDGHRIVNANCEILPDGESGILCRQNADDLAAAIARLAANPQLRRRLGESAHHRVLQRYTWNRAGLALAPLLEDLGAPIRSKLSVRQSGRTQPEIALQG